jgi:hypothetical protein
VIARAPKGTSERGGAFSPSSGGFLTRQVANMRKLMSILAITAALVGCAPGEIGEVDHSCHVNPYDELGSSCR